MTARGGHDKVCNVAGCATPTEGPWYDAGPGSRYAVLLRASRQSGIQHVCRKCALERDGKDKVSAGVRPLDSHVRSIF